MSYNGDIRLGSTIGFKFTTRQVSGVPTTLAGTPVISVYAAGSNSPITAGVTLTVDYPKTGLNDVSIVASGANGFATATNYDVVITTGTVNSVSVVGEVIGSFSIENRSALMPATAGRTAVVDAAGLIDANMVKAGPTGSGTAQTTGDIFARLGAPAGASMSADIAAVKSDTGAIKLKTDNLPSDPADASDIAASLAVILAAIPSSATIATAVLTTSMTEAYAADGAAPTLAQAMFLTQQSLHEFAISGVTRTVYGLDGTTVVATFTLNSATAPTATTRAT